MAGIRLFVCNTMSLQRCAVGLVYRVGAGRGDVYSNRTTTVHGMLRQSIFSMNETALENRTIPRGSATGRCINQSVKTIIK